MPDEPTPTTDPETPGNEPEGVEEAPADPETPPEDAPADAEPNPEDEQNDDDLPDWARERLTKANAEAANYRIKLRNAETQLTDAMEKAKSLEEMQVALDQFKSDNAKLEREVLVSTVAREFKLPTELAEVLQGSTEEELKAHAEKLAKFAPKGRAVKLDDLAGGLDPDESGDTFDPVAEGRKARLNRNR